MLGSRLGLPSASSISFVDITFLLFNHSTILGRIAPTKEALHIVLVVPVSSTTPSHTSPFGISTAFVSSLFSYRWRLPVQQSLDYRGQHFLQTNTRSPLAPTMPSLEIQSPVVPGVSAVDSLLEELLQHAEIVKQTASIEPALATSDFEDLPARLIQALAPTGSPEDTDENGDISKARRFAIIETVARDKFSNLIVSG